MSLYNCENCGVIENTALGLYWFRHDEEWPDDIRGKALCSECAPATYPDGTPTDWGKWHGKFPKEFKPVSVEHLPHDRPRAT